MRQATQMAKSSIQRRDVLTTIPLLAVLSIVLAVEYGYAYATKRRHTFMIASMAGILLAVGVPYGLLQLHWQGSTDDCISEELGTKQNLYGATFEVVDTNCDTLIKNEAIRVYISRPRVGQSSWFSKWRNHRELIFDYDPDSNDRPPVIEASGNNRVLISVSKVSHVFVQRRTWEEIFFDYRIGRIIDP